jgi:Cytochrome P450
MLLLATGLVSILVLVLFYDFSKKLVCLSMPGPFSFPLVGHVPYLTVSPWLRFAEWSVKYGSIYKMFIWRRLFVVVSDPDAVKRILVTKRHIYAKDDWSYKFFK